MARKYRPSNNTVSRLREHLSNLTKPFTLGDLFQKFRVRDNNERTKIAVAIEALCKENRIVLGDDKRYRVCLKGDELTGVLDMTSGGFGFLVVEGKEEDVFIPPYGLQQALHGDTIRVFVHKTKRRFEGEVLEVLKRARDEFVGVLHENSVGYSVAVDHRRMQLKINIASKALKDAKAGQKVLVKLTDWEKGQLIPNGEIVDVLGDAGDNTTEMHAIL
ncbi:MAG: hypothetical protein ACRCSB_01115, partial [Bacteroidales bacterium]